MSRNRKPTGNRQQKQTLSVCLVCVSSCSVVLFFKNASSHAFRKCCTDYDFQNCQQLQFSKMLAIIMFRTVTDYVFQKGQQLEVSKMLAIMIFKTFSNQIFQNVSSCNCSKVVGYYIVSKMLAIITFKSVRKYTLEEILSIVSSKGYQL